MKEAFPIFQNDLIKAQNKPSSFPELKEDLSYINVLLNSPILSIRKKKFIEFIEKIESQMRRKYKKLEENVDLYLKLYEDFKASGVTINGYIYNQDKPEDNVLFVGNEIKRVGDILWSDVTISRIGKGEILVNYKNNRLILHCLEE